MKPDAPDQVTFDAAHATPTAGDAHADGAAVLTGGTIPDAADDAADDPLLSVAVTVTRRNLPASPATGVYDEPVDDPAAFDHGPPAEAAACH